MPLSQVLLRRDLTGKRCIMWTICAIQMRVAIFSMAFIYSFIYLFYFWGDSCFGDFSLQCHNMSKAYFPLKYFLSFWISGLMYPLAQLFFFLSQLVSKFNSIFNFNSLFLCDANIFERVTLGIGICTSLVSISLAFTDIYVILYK